MKSLRLAILLPDASIAATALTACGSSASSDDGVVQVVAGENFWGDVAAQVGGSHVKVTSVLSNPDDDPHEYESSSRNAIAVATSRLVIENGLGYDDFMGKLVDSSGAHPRVLDVADVLGVRGEDPNPHLWYDAARLPDVAATIADELGALDPKDKATFEANAQEFDKSLQPLLDVIAQIKEQYAGTEIAYTERVPGYLVEAAGLQLGIPASFAQAVEEGSDPSPRDLVAHISRVRTADGEPMAIEHTYVPAKLAPGLAQKALDGSLYQLLTETYHLKIEKAEQSIHATVLDPPAEYPQYEPGYYAVFFADPDGLKLELVHVP